MPILALNLSAANQRSPRILPTSFFLTNHKRENFFFVNKRNANRLAARWLVSLKEHFHPLKKPLLRLRFSPHTPNQPNLKGQSQTQYFSSFARLCKTLACTIINPWAKSLTETEKKIAATMGHQNHLQKIRYLDKLKDENHKFREENLRLNRELSRSAAKIRQLEEDARFNAGDPMLYSIK